MKIHIGICSVHPDAIETAKAIMFYANPQFEIVWHMLQVLSPGGNVHGNPYTGYAFITKNVVEHPNVESIVGALLHVTEPKFVIAEYRNSAIPLEGIYLHETYSVLDTGCNILQFEYVVEKARTIGALSTLVPGLCDEQVTQFEIKKPVAVPAPTTSPENNIVRRIILIASEDYNSVIPGIGMYGLLENLCVSLASLCKTNGYNLLLTSENRLGNVVFAKDDLVIGLAVNGFYRGGYTNQWLGFSVGNLMHIGRATKAVGAKCIIVSSAHSSEFRLYGNLDAGQLASVSDIKFCGFHNYINTVLAEKSLNFSLNSFPIPFTTHNIPEQNRIAGKEKRVMFQFDTQARKNGEQILAALYDAYCLAVEQDPAVKLKVICKTTAAHGFTNSSYLDKLKTNWNMAATPGFSVNLEGRVGESWTDSIKKTDIFLALSTDEGVHYFVPEMWLSGAHIVLQAPGPCSSYLSLGESIHVVSGQEVENCGTGFYNDNFMTKVNSFNYYETVMKLKELILNPISIASKKHIASRSFDSDGKLLANFFGLAPSGRTNWVLERNGAIFTRIIGGPKWPR